jgi:hypothetical protein
MRANLRGVLGCAVVASLCGLGGCQHGSPGARGPGDGSDRSAGALHGMHLRVAALVPKAPVTLTSSDGKGLTLTHLAARAVLEGPLAFTELHLAFANPLSRTLEGTFAITLPQRASISRFAMRIGTEWQEGEVVEKQRARVAFEDFLHVRRDPALLEQSAGNEFTARVFPIPPNGTKEIVVSYAQELRGTEPYVLPLKGLPQIDAVDLSATTEGANLSLAARHEESWAPDQDFVVPRASLANADGLRSDDLVLARVHPQVDTKPDPVGSAIVLVDTSASRAFDLDAQAKLVGELASKIGANEAASLTVACFDQGVDETFSGSARSFAAGDADRIRARSALGASNLGRALAWAHDRARAVGARRVLVLSDGVATAGETDRAKLVEAAKSLREAGVERLDALAMGGIRDDAVLASLTRAGLARDGIVADATEGAGETARRLGSATRSGIAVKVQGAQWSYPRTIDGAQPGDEYLVYAQVSPGAPVAISVGGAAEKVADLQPAERPLVERAWAQAKIASLLDDVGAPGGKEAVREQVVALSTRHRVLSPYTAMLVLESDRDYQRFHMERDALADVLQVQGSRVALTHRRDPVLTGGGKGWVAPEPAPRAPTGPAPTAPAGRAAQFGVIGLANADPPSSNAPVAPWGRDDSSSRGNMFGPSSPAESVTGGLGLSGTGEGGSGQGEGIGSSVSSSDLGHASGAIRGAHLARPPALREETSTISGRLPTEVIQRIVRQSFGRFRACYEAGLRRNRSLEGRVAVKFVIDRTGAVVSAADGGSDIGDAIVVQCVVAAFAGLSFPAPDGSSVTVVYPIHFAPEGGTARASDADPSLPASPSAPPPRIPPLGTPDDGPVPGEPYAGRFADVMRAVESHDAKHALELAWAWRDDDAGDALALVALGEALEANGDAAAASRAYGSIVDLFPSSADMRRMAGERLERVHDASALDLATDDYAKAVEDRPDHPSSHRMLAYALLKKRDYAGAFDAAVAGLAHPYSAGRYVGVERILREDVGLIGAAWAAAEPAKRDAIIGRVRSAGATVEDTPSLRFVLSWESDANDVDLHVRDADGNHAYYEHPTLPTGGVLYADVRTGYGPECFAIDAPPGKRSPHYSLQVDYYARGPMGYGMGKVEIVEHDGHGGLAFDERPFVVMNDQSFVDLGSY